MDEASAILRKEEWNIKHFGNSSCFECAIQINLTSLLLPILFVLVLIVPPPLLPRVPLLLLLLIPLLLFLVLVLLVVLVPVLLLLLPVHPECS